MLVRAFRDRALGALRKRLACSCSVRFCLVGVAMKPVPFDYQVPAPFAKQSTCSRRTPRRSSSPRTKPDAGSRLPPVDPEPAVDLRRLPGLGNIAVGDDESVRSRIQRTRALRRINTAALFTAVPKVRIRFPPAGSPLRTRHGVPRSKVRQMEVVSTRETSRQDRAPRHGSAAGPKGCASSGSGTSGKRQTAGRNRFFVDTPSGTAALGRKTPSVFFPLPSAERGSVIEAPSMAQPTSPDQARRPRRS
jgi:hypothetical protein